MKNRIPKITAAIFAAFLCFATALAEPAKLKFAELVDLKGALLVLDGIPKEIRTADGSKIIRVPLDLKAATRIAASKNLAAVNPALDAIEAQRQVILQKVSPGAPEKIDSDQGLKAKFFELWNSYVEKNAVTVEVVKMTEESLNLEVNKEITGSVLAGLAPVLK